MAKAVYTYDQLYDKVLAEAGQALFGVSDIDYPASAFVSLLETCVAELAEKFTRQTKVLIDVSDSNAYLLTLPPNAKITAVLDAWGRSVYWTYDPATATLTVPSAGQYIVQISQPSFYIDREARKVYIEEAEDILVHYLTARFLKALSLQRALRVEGMPIETAAGELAAEADRRLEEVKQEIEAHATWWRALAG